MTVRLKNHLGRHGLTAHRLSGFLRGESGDSVELLVGGKLGGLAPNGRVAKFAHKIMAEV